MNQPESRRIPKPITGHREPQPTPVPGKTPGVGYVPTGLSHAGADHGHQPVPFNLSVDLEGASGEAYLDRLSQMVAGGVREAAMAGAPGFEWPQVQQILRRAWEYKETPLLTNPEAFDGIPTETEVRRAYFAQKGDTLFQRFYQGLAARDASKGTPPPAVPASPAGADPAISALDERVKRIEQMLHIEAK